MKTILLAGASKGLGNSLIDGLGQTGDTFFLLSRTRPAHLDEPRNFKKIWIPSDLADPNCTEPVMTTIGQTPIDVVLYNAGIWEKTGFEEVSAAEISSIIQVNLTSVLLLLQKLLPNLRQGALKKIILIGSTCGLENEGSDAVVYNATKFGLRGVTHALREYLRKDGIAVSCISPGSIASDVPFRSGAEAALARYGGERMPVADMVSLVKVIIESSAAACIKEIHVPALRDTDV